MKAASLDKLTEEIRLLEELTTIQASLAKVQQQLDLAHEALTLRGLSPTTRRMVGKVASELTVTRNRATSAFDRIWRLGHIGKVAKDTEGSEKV